MVTRVTIAGLHLFTAKDLLQNKSVFLLLAFYFIAIDMRFYRFKFLKLFLVLLPFISIAYPVYAVNDTSSTAPATTKKHELSKDKDTDADFFVLKSNKLSTPFFVRLLIDILSLIVLIRLIYYPVYRKSDFLFTLFMFNIVIFLITYLLNKVELSTGAAFGLFAVFSLLRYRTTEDITARDMTYLFLIIALGLVTSVNKGNIYEIITINLLIIITAFVLDGNVLIRNEIVITINYDNMELIKVENQPALIEDLRKRTGLDIHKVSIDKIDYPKNTASLTVYYYKAANKRA